MPIVCTAQNDIASVLLEMDYTGEAGTQTSVTITRSVDGGPFESFIGYGLLCEQGFYYDTTMPLDVPITYHARTSDGFESECTVTVLSGGFVWFKDPGRPWANIRLDLCMTPTPPATPGCADPEEPIALIQFGSESNEADVALFPLLADPHPSDTFSRRKDVSTSVQFASRTCEAIDSVRTLFEAGGPILIQAPAVYCWPDRFLQPGELQMEYISRDQRKPWRLWSVPLTTVDRPFIGTIQGVEGQTWCDIIDTYPTYADFTAGGFTWADVVVGDAIPTPPSELGYGGGEYGDGPYGD